MPKSEFEVLKKMIEQLGLEFQEFASGIETKFNNISNSLKSCQSHCHVRNQEESKDT